MKKFLFAIIFSLLINNILNLNSNYLNSVDRFNDKLKINPSDLADKLIEQTFQFLVKHSNISIIIENINNDPICKESFLNVFSNKTLLGFIIQYSGKGFGDIGLHQECENLNLFYLFLQFKVNITNLFGNNTEYFYLYTFIEDNLFFTGLCIPEQCKTFYRNFLDKENNPQFFNYLEAEIGILEIKSNLSEKTTTNNSKSICTIILIAILVIIITKIWLTIYGIIIFKIKDDVVVVSQRYAYESFSSDSSSSCRSISNASELFCDKKIKDGLFKFKKYSKFKYCLYIIFKIFNYQSHFKYLTKLKNKYHDDTGLEFISFLRGFAFIFVIINYNIYSLVKIPHQDFRNYNFFTQFWFCIVKFSTFFIEIWIILDGFLMTYKLMSFLKKHKEINKINESQSYCLKTFLKFYGIICTKFFLFYFSLFVLHIYLGNFISVFFDSKDKNPIFQNILENKIENRVCAKDPLSLLIPFYLSYHNEKSESFNNCYRFLIIYTNEFYSFTFMILIFYLAHKLKNKFFDFGILILLFLTINFSFLSYGDEKHNVGDVYTFSYVLGDTKSLKLTHLFISTYMLGNFSGLIYFYYNDIISSNPTASEYGYIPFKFCYSIMKLIDRSSELFKVFLFYFSNCIMILLSMSFYLFVMVNTKDYDSEYNHSDILPERDFNLKITPVMYFFYIYEKKLFQLAYIVMLLCALIHQKVAPILTYVQSRRFVPFNRIDVTLLCISDISVYIFYSIYSTQIFLNIMNVLIISTGLMLIIFSISFFLNSLLEMPLRIIYKKLFRLHSHSKQILK